MTKAELIKALAGFPDEGEIFVNAGDNPAIPIVAIIAPPDSGDDCAYIVAEESQ